jgi:DNA-binding GntR family transcriptional regulator
MLQARLRRIRYVGNESPEKWAAAVADHEDMIAALEARDGERLATALTDHMQNTWHRVRGSI